MSQPEEYDVVVLGSGPFPASSWRGPWPHKWKAAAVVERRYVGGSCPNIACLPSKNVIHGLRSPTISVAEGVRDRQRRLEGRHGRRPRPQEEDGAWTGRNAPRASTGKAAR